MSDVLCLEQEINKRVIIKRANYFTRSITLWYNMFNVQVKFPLYRWATISWFELFWWISKFQLKTNKRLVKSTCFLGKNPKQILAFIISRLKISSYWNFKLTSCVPISNSFCRTCQLVSRTCQQVCPTWSKLFSILSHFSK